MHTSGIKGTLALTESLHALVEDLESFYSAHCKLITKLESFLTAANLDFDLSFSSTCLILQFRGQTLEFVENLLLSFSDDAKENTDDGGLPPLKLFQIVDKQPLRTFKFH